MSTASASSAAWVGASCQPSQNLHEVSPGQNWQGPKTTSGLLLPRRRARSPLRPPAWHEVWRRHTLRAIRASPPSLALCFTSKSKTQVGARVGFGQKPETPRCRCAILSASPVLTSFPCGGRDLHAGSSAASLSFQPVRLAVSRNLSLRQSGGKPPLRPRPRPPLGELARLTVCGLLLCLRWPLFSPDSTVSALRARGEASHSVFSTSRSSDATQKLPLTLHSGLSGRSSKEK
jgi:hypothetical protein